MGGSQRGNRDDWLCRHHRFRRGSWQTTGNIARIPETLHWLGYRLQETEESGWSTELENFIFATMLRTTVGTKELLTHRVRGFIPREVKAFVYCRLTIHTPAVSAKEWNKLGNARSARQFWKSRSVVSHGKWFKCVVTSLYTMFPPCPSNRCKIDHILF
jgi:hypothetical protein